MPAPSERTPQRAKASLSTEQSEDFKHFKQAGKQRANLLGTRPTVNNTHTPINTHTRANNESGNDSLTPTSRLCVKGIPASMTEAKLSQHFQSLSGVTLTDTRIMRTPEGKSRQFAFLGFKSPGEALRAKQHFDKTFLGASRVSVQFALERGSSQLERPWSKYSELSSKAQKLKSGTDNTAIAAVVDHRKPKYNDRLSSLLASILPTEKVESLLSDKTFLDYYHAMGGTNKAQRQFWANDESDAHTRTTAGSGNSDLNQNEKEQVMKLLKSQMNDSDSDSDDDEAFNNPSVNLSALAAKGKSTAGADSAETRQNDDEDVDENDSDASDDAAMTDGVSSSDAHTQGSKDCGNAAGSIDPTRLFILNLPYQLTDDEFETMLDTHGTVTHLHLPRTADGKCKGFGFVNYSTEREANTARNALNNKIIMGRIVRIQSAQARPVTDAEADNSIGKSQTYKSKKQQEQKSTALTLTASWNSLFLRPDTVMAAMAAKLGVSKSELLNSDDQSSLAVRMALAETTLIHDTKEWLESNGISMAVLERRQLEQSKKENKAGEKMKRSNRILLVKHTPYDSDINELKKLFEHFGPIVRITMPPSKVMALVEFGESHTAKKAFASLAYTKYKHVPLFLEWAPADTESSVASTNNDNDSGSGSDSQKPSASSLVAGKDDTAAANSSTVFVKNLSFTTTDASLTALVQSVCPVRSLTVAQKKNSKEKIAAGEPKTLSMGYGFIECHDSAGAKKMIGFLNGREIDGHVVTASVSTRAAKTSSQTGSDSHSDIPSSRLIVKNLPFEATVEELQSLFASHTELKKIRLPRKVDGRHRGFAFIDFLSKNEAKKAVTLLGNTHLYGRKLIMEFSQEGDADADDSDAEVPPADDQPKKKRRKQ